MTLVCAKGILNVWTLEKWFSFICKNIYKSAIKVVSHLNYEMFNTLRVQQYFSFSNFPFNTFPK